MSIGNVTIGKSDVVGFLHHLHLQPIMATFGEASAGRNALRVADRAGRLFKSAKSLPILGQMVKAAELRVPELALIDYGSEMLSDLEKAVGFDPTTGFERNDYRDNMNRRDQVVSEDRQQTGQTGFIDVPHYAVGTKLYDTYNSNMTLSMK